MFKAEVGLVADEMFVGQRTTAPGYCDVDFVIYSKSKEIKLKESVLQWFLIGIDPVMVIQNGYDDIQDKLENYMKKHLSPHYKYCDRTHVAVKFTYKQLEVDLLLSPYWDTREEYYTFMRKIQHPRDRYHW